MLSEQTGETMKPIDSSSSPVLIDLTSRVERRRQGAAAHTGILLHLIEQHTRKSCDADAGEGQSGGN